MKHSHLSIYISVFVCALLLWSNLGIGIDRGLATWRDGLHRRVSTGQFVLIEIDARSIAAIDHWPWPRGIFAEAVQKLDRLGAKTIAFDIDFSSRTTSTEDGALAKALTASSAAIVLPTFKQSSSQDSLNIVENLPLPILRQNSMLAAVNIRADRDGLVRSYPYAITTSGAPRPSIGAMLGNAAGTSETGFPIDGSIDPASIPHFSFVDLIHGRVPAAAIRGRSVLLGATAIELGDRYPMPGRGVIPGPLIQLLAAETLAQGSSPSDYGAVLGALFAIACVALAGRFKGGRASLIFAVALLIVFALPLVSEMCRLGTFQIAPALGILLFAWITELLLGAFQATRQARLFDEGTGLRNHRSLQIDLAEMTAGSITVYRVSNHSDVVDVLGQAGASDLIRQIADRLHAATGEIIYRIEENAVAWAAASRDADMQENAIDRAAALIRSSYFISGRKVESEGAFGLAVYANQESIGRATTAADHAIASGHRWIRHDQSLSHQADHRLRVIGEIDTAIEAGQIWVAYQPKLDIRTGRICSSEALVRWKHPDFGPIAPDAFIPALEESGRIQELTLHVVETALTDQARLAREGFQIGTAVNISARLPADPDFLTRLQAIFERFPDQISKLTLEVTESATLKDPEATIIALRKLASLGVRLSIDDYGTGQSTLSYLKQLPASEIKIDKSFVQNLVTSKGDQAMVRSTIDLAHELGFTVVAEGIETREILALLSGLQCDFGQGWHIGKPMPIEDFLAVLAQAERIAA